MADVTGRSRVQRGIPTGGQFATMERDDPDDDLPEDDFDPDEWPLEENLGEMDEYDIDLNEDRDVAHPDISEADRELFIHGNCGVLAYRVAKANDWGMRMYGELDLSDVETGYDLTSHDPNDPGSPYIGVESLWHAFAVRPDGMLVDVRGVHDPEAMEQVYGSQATRFDYPDADTCDRLWNYEQWLGSDLREFDLDFTSDDEELGHADHIAALVTQTCGQRCRKCNAYLDRGMCPEHGCIGG